MYKTQFIVFLTAANGVRHHDSNGTRHEVHVRTGGILSAGAIGSPQLLLLSGLGPNSSLLSLNILVVGDHPFVRQFMADNPRNSINLLVPVRLTDVGVRVAGITNSGPYVESLTISRVSRPKSTGSLNLISSFDVTVGPRVQFNYYSNTEDLLQCRNIVDVFRNVLETQAVEEYKFPSIIGLRHFSYIGPSIPTDPSDEESIATFCRKTLATFWHHHGGCLVNKVVDSHL
ncbi:putative (R)-mandelonitrile lyase [Helianthus annuus]|nr:putative (R)-mandelonitrile lyase [Helianthus annuus]